MRKELSHLPKPVAKTIAAFYRRQRFHELMRAFVAPLLCYGVVALVAMHLDRFLFLDLSARLWISGVTHALGLVVLIVSLGVYAWRRRTVSSVAYDMERVLPASAEERLVTLNDVLGRPADGRAADPKVHAAMVGQLTAETLALCERTRHVGRLARDRVLRRGLAALALLAIVWSGFALLPHYQFGLMWKRLTFPRMNLPKPSFVRLVVTPEAPVIARRGEVVLQVQVEGDIPAWFQKPMKWLGADSSVCLMAKATGRVDRLAFTADARPMSRVQRRLFVASMTDLQETFSYRVRCGDAETDIRLVRVVAQPRIVNASVQVEPPAYTGLKTVVHTELRDPVPAYAASKVRLMFGSDQSPLKSARLVDPQTGATLRELTLDPKTGMYLYKFDMTASFELEIVIVNDLGFENDEHVRLSMALLEDQPPVVRMDYPAGDVTAAQGELVPMHMELSDDLGLLEAGIRFQVNASQNAGASVREIPLTLETNLLIQSKSAEFDLEKAGVVAGDEVLMWVTARDTGRNDANSQFIRIRVAALAGNENEHRRILALRSMAQILAALQTSGGAWSFDGEAYDKVVAEAKTRDFELDSRPAVESLLTLMEKEHHFTDSAASAADMRMFRGVIAALANPPGSFRASPDGSLDARKAALRQLTNSILPGLRIERTGRDIARRALNLRGEVESMMAGQGAAERRNGAGFERRVNLLLEALDDTSEEFIKLSAMAPQVKKEDILAFSQKISRAGRDFKQSGSGRRTAGESLCEQIDGWIGLLLPVLPEWNQQHRAAREELRALYERVRKPIDAAAKVKGEPDSMRWLAADARMIERNPYAGLGERLASVAPGRVDAVAAPVAAALAGEAALFARLAIEDEYAEWLESPRLKPAEQRLAEALRALDLADSDAARAAAAERMRTLKIQDTAGTESQGGASAQPAMGLYGFLPTLTTVAASASQAHEKEIESLISQATRLQDLVKGAGGEDGSVGGLIAGLGPLQSGVAKLETEATRVLALLHLDVSYGDPQREGAVRLTTAIPPLRSVFDRYQAVVPPLIDRLRGMAGKTSERDVANATMGGEELVRSVAAVKGGLDRVLKHLRGEGPTVNETYGGKEMRFYLSSARKLADARDPGEIARSFFAAQPAAAAMVLERQLPALAGALDCLRNANETLKTQPPDSPAFRDPMRQAAQLVIVFEQTLLRYNPLDPDGAAVAAVGSIRKRTETLAGGGSEKSVERTKLAMDELLRQAQEFETLAKELVLRVSPAPPSGWWGGPAGIWEGASRRDAERARLRVMSQFERARRAAALGFDAVLTRKEKGGGALPDQPLAGALFAWRAMQSSLGGTSVVEPPKPPIIDEQNPLVKWLLKELEEARKARRILSKHAFADPTDRWFDTMSGILRRGSAPEK